MFSNQTETAEAIPWAPNVLTRTAPAQQQPRLLDCGVFVIAWAHALANDLDVVNLHPFNQTHMPILRCRLALRVLERCHK